MKTLLLGGVKSGKSRYAEQLATESGKQVTVIATAMAGDAEMTARIERHRLSRPAEWHVLEEPLDVAGALTQVQSNHQEPSTSPCVVIDCLTLWMTQLLCSGRSSDAIDGAIHDCIEAVSAFHGDLIIVSNETNMGVMPMDALSRQYCDRMGRLHQTLTRHVERVTLMVAGLPLTVK